MAIKVGDIIPTPDGDIIVEEIEFKPDGEPLIRTRQISDSSYYMTVSELPPTRKTIEASLSDPYTPPKPDEWGAIVVPYCKSNNIPLDTLFGEGDWVRWVSTEGKVLVGQVKAIDESTSDENPQAVVKCYNPNSKAFEPIESTVKFSQLRTLSASNLSAAIPPDIANADEVKRDLREGKIKQAQFPSTNIIKRLMGAMGTATLHSRNHADMEKKTEAIARQWKRHVYRRARGLRGSYHNIEVLATDVLFLLESNARSSDDYQVEAERVREAREKARELINEIDRARTGVQVMPMRYTPNALVYVKSLHSLGRVSGVSDISGVRYYNVQLLNASKEVSGYAIASEGDLEPRRQKALKKKIFKLKSPQYLLMGFSGTYLH